MTDALRELLPTAPDLGLFVAPDIPADKLAAAIGDYATGTDPARVVALFDATRMGSAKDGALFLADRFVFQNHNFQTPRTVRYADVVGVRQTRSLLGGRAVELDLNRGRATVTERLDVSGRPGAAEFLERALHEVMLRAHADDAREETPAEALEETAAETPRTERAAVRAALDALVARGALAPTDRDRMLGALGGA